MKAAVIHQFGDVPHYEDFPDPPSPTEGELRVQVQAVVLENVLRSVVNGSHYASRQFLSRFPAVIGVTGIGTLENGKMVGFGGVKAPYGPLAETAIISERSYANIPEGVDAVTAAALPASALTALFSLKGAARLEPGETVLVQGATGVSGRQAIQVAKLLNAGRIVATGRNEESLRELEMLGVDTVIDLKQSDEDLTAAFHQAAGTTGYQVILDFIWGHPTDVLLKALVPHNLSLPQHRTRLIHIGEAAGSTVSLPGASLRTSGLEIYGAGANLTPETIAEGTTIVWDWIKEGKLHMNIERVPLREVESAWLRTDVHGKRLVIVP